MKKQNDEISIKDFVSLFAPKLWLIVVCAVVLGMLLGGYSLFLKSDTYTSKASLMVSMKNSSSISASDIALSSMIIENLEVVLFSRDFLEVVAEDINTNESYQKQNWNVNHNTLRRAISFTPNGETSTFDLTITTSSNLLSYVIANTVIDHIMGDTLAKFLPSAYSAIIMTRIESPLPNTTKNDKGVLTSTLVGLLVGAVGSMAVVYISAMFDVVIHDRKKLEDNFDIPILGVIPRYDVDEETVKEVGKNAGTQA
jgi:capsular polysaccharide biosynthesis protein